MPKYHINRNGMPAICRAEKRPCPLGGPDEHYDSEIEAEAAAFRKMAKASGMLGSSNKPETVAPRYQAGYGCGTGQRSSCR